MKILWDEPKRLANLDKHRLDFGALTEAFFNGSVVVPGKAFRFVAIGQLGRQKLAVVFARLGTEGITVISMRPASRKERVQKP